MKRMLTSAVSLVLVLSLVTAPDMFAQTRRSSGGSTSSATRSSSGPAAYRIVTVEHLLCLY